MTLGTHPTPEQLSAFLDGELPDAERTATASHVAACEVCRTRVDDWRALGEMTEDTLPAPPPAYFDSFGARLRPRLVARPRRLARPWMAAVAAAMVLAVLVPVVLRQPVVQEPAPTAAARPAAPLAVEQAPSVGAEKPAPGGGAAHDRAQLPSPARLERRDEDTDAGKAAKVLAPPPVELDAPPPPPPAAPATDARRDHQEAFAEAPVAQSQEAEETKRAGETLGAAAATAPTVMNDAARGKAEQAPGRARLGATGAPAPSVEEARRLRESWRRQVASLHGEAADEARVRVVEMGVRAWKVGGAEADRRQAQVDAEAYLRWPGGQHRDIVRTLRDELTR